MSVTAHPGPPQLPPEVVSIARDVRRLGGRALVVGGWVRDWRLGSAGKDLDVEVFGLPVPELEKVLRARGQVLQVGRAFGVLRVKGLDVDFSVPRRDSKVGKGHRGFRVEADPGMTPEQAVRRRDLTINALLLDPLTQEVLDPAGGLEDLQARRLRAVDASTFPEDPLRPLRVAQLAARLEFRVDTELVRLCRSMPMDDLPAERRWEEWAKLLLRGRRPSRGLGFLLAADLLRETPPLLSLVGVPQDPEWHPEGDVWEHTLRSVDAAAALRSGRRDEDLQVMLAALCHDLGKATTTRFVEGRWRSHQHDVEGLGPAASLLSQIGAPRHLFEPVELLVRWHLQPTWLHYQAGGPRAYRRLARRLDAAGTRMSLLERVARADALGRTTPDAAAGIFEAGDGFLRTATELQVAEASPPNVVLGRHLIARGLEPGPAFGPILARCREIQDETGWEDPGRILDRVWEEGKLG